MEVEKLTTSRRVVKRKINSLSTIVYFDFLFRASQIWVKDELQNTDD